MHVKPGDCFMCDSGEGLPVFGEVLEGYPGELLAALPVPPVLLGGLPGRRAGRRARLDDPVHRVRRGLLRGAMSGTMSVESLACGSLTDSTNGTKGE